MKSPLPPLLVMAGSQLLLKNRSIRSACQVATAAGWRTERADGSVRGAVEASLSDTAVFGDGVLVRVVNPEKQDVKLYEAWVAAPTEGICLLLDYDGEPKGNTKFGKWVGTLTPKQYRCFTLSDKPWEAAKEATKFVVDEFGRWGKTLDEDYAKAIVERSGSDLGVLSYEVMKICLLADAEGTTKIEAKHIKPCLAEIFEVAADPIIEALGEKNKKKLAQALYRLRHSAPNDPTIPISYLLAKTGQRWLKVASVSGKDPALAAQELNIHPWYFKNKLLPPARTWGVVGAAKLIQTAAAIERSVKSGHISPWNELEARLFALV